jgi:hypothetical protein
MAASTTALATADIGYQGGYWGGGHFNYNRSVNNINTSRVHNVYNRSIERKQPGRRPCEFQRRIGRCAGASQASGTGGAA